MISILFQEQKQFPRGTSRSRFIQVLELVSNERRNRPTPQPSLEDTSLKFREVPLLPTRTVHHGDVRIRVCRVSDWLIVPRFPRANENQSPTLHQICSAMSQVSVKRDTGQ